MRTDTFSFAQPGKAHGAQAHNMNCQDVDTGALADGLKKAIEKECKGCTHLVALVIDPGRDFHWYRLNDDGYWSHKPADTPATDLDASDNKITNPETADRDHTADYGVNYTIFCGYYCVDKKFVVIE